MKRVILLFLASCILTTGCVALAENERRMMTLSGSVVAGETKAVLAPFGGRLSDVSLEPGDLVGPGDSLFMLDTTKVYAPCDGRVGDVGVKVGDDVAYLQDRYGALIFIEPQSRYIIETDTKYAYTDSDNQVVHVGERVYIGSRNNSKRVATGFVTQVEGETYTVEVADGNLIIDDSVSIFRESDFSSRSKIGTGTTELNTNVPVTSEGSVFKVHVRQGDRVRRGDVLLETVKGSLDYNPLPTNSVQSGYAAIVATVDVQAGANVEKNQSMATLYPIDKLQVAVDVGEADLKNIVAGDTVRIEIASLGEDEPMDGVISAISGLGVEDEVEMRYTVSIDFEATESVRMGMSATVSFNQ